MYNFIKRLIDIFLSSILLLIFFPIIIISSVLVKISSPGPIFYRAERAGLYGKKFLIIKLRTMYVGSDKGSGTTAFQDPRIVKYGTFLRNYKIDEMPQLINVLIGDMSLVGPRPELLDYVKRYKGDEKKIMNVKPGITDYSSIHFFSQELWVGKKNAQKVFDKHVLHVKNSLRLKYVNEQSLFTDIKILILTFINLLKKIFFKKKGV
jgi:lipopolysaccharide/colanic/teichoic acid biosynthesis glycosyltransferase